MGTRLRVYDAAACISTGSAIFSHARTHPKLPAVAGTG
jgi:hypothetical protein